MANEHREPRRAAPGVLLAGLSILCSGAAALLILLHRPAWGGAAAIASAALQGIAAAAGAQTGRSRLAWGAGGPLADSAVLAPVAWVYRMSESGIAELALVTLGVCLVSSYERARGLALGYPTKAMWGLRLVRQAAVGIGVMAGGGALRAALWIALAIATASLIVRAAGVAQGAASSREARRGA